MESLEGAEERGVNREPIHERAVGRWKSILPLCGVSVKALSGKHGPCPVCGGKDRFRFDNKEGRGTWFCSHCGAGNGIDLVMKVKGIQFFEAAKMVEQHIGYSRVDSFKAKTSDRQEKDRRDQMTALWGSAKPLAADDLASRYLAARGLKAADTASLRFIRELPFHPENKPRVLLPAMLAKFAAPDGKSAMLHRTFLTEPGRKADLGGKERMFMPGKVPQGGAVRLGPVAETMGVAEGIETAMSAAQINGIPVWATCTAGALMKWQPPKGCKNVIVFGDLDASFTGQMASYSLAYRLRGEWCDDAKTEHFSVSVRFTQFDDTGNLKEDWNDMLAA